MENTHTDNLDLAFTPPRECSDAPECSTNSSSTMANYSARVLTDISQILALKDEWLELDQSNTTVAFFQCWQWVANFLEFAAADPDFQPMVLTASNNGKLVSILPLAVQKRTARRILTGLTEPFQQYTEMLLAPNTDPQGIFNLWVPAIRESGNDVMHLGQVRADSNLYKAMKGVVAPSGELEAAPYVDLQQWADFNGYYQSVKSKTRKNIRNARNRLETQAPISHEVSRGGEKLSEIINKTFRWRKEWLDRTGQTSRAFSDQEFARFIDRFSSEKSSREFDINVIGMSLKHGDQPIAEQWGFIHKQRYYAFISGWDTEYEISSPGKLHLGEVLETCYDLDIHVADFMIPSVPYKSTWAKATIEVQDYVLPLSFRGNVYNRLWLDFARPIAKSLVYKIPKPVRAVLFRLVGL